MVVGEASIHNIMGGMESTGGVRLHNHKRKLKQRFDIIKKLGQGTYGKVQLGINKETGQEVAIKTIKKCKIETEADLVRIRREIQIMSSVQHPNIIHIYEVFENREKMVLVMEYAAGGELYDYLSERKVLSEQEARRIFRQIATAVFYCHKHKICHRDLKLENILLDQTGNAKIADFGLSNVFDEQRLLNTFCGSPLYASPEIVKGTPYHGPEVDCWSLGVLLYTLVYGAMPFDGSNFKRLVKQISQSDYFEPKKPSPASPLIKDMLTACPGRRADIEKICSHWWVNEGYEQSCLDIAEDLAAQTPVRLDLLLSLVPQSASAEKLLVGDQQTSGDVVNSISTETVVPTRCHSVGSLMELDQNNSDRRIRELFEEDSRAVATSDAKRKLETTPSMDETMAVGVKRKERSRRKERTDEREPRAYRSTSRHHSAPIPNSITEECMEIDSMPTVPTAKVTDLNKVDAAACLELIEESKEKSPVKERSKIPNVVDDRQLFKQISTENVEKYYNVGQEENKIGILQEDNTEVTENNIPTQESVPLESSRSMNKLENRLISDEQFDNTSKLNVPNESSSSNVIKSNDFTVQDKIVDPTEKEIKKLKERAYSLDSELLNEAGDLSGKSVERRRSKIFEIAEKFNQMASNVETEKPDKIFIPGVNVGGAKRAFERKASLSSIMVPPAIKSNATKVIIDVPVEKKSEKIDDRTKCEKTVDTEEKVNKEDEAKKRAVDIITGAIGKPPMLKKINGSPPISPQNQDSKKLGLKIQVAPNDVRSATVSVSTPIETMFPFDNNSNTVETTATNDSSSVDNSQAEEPKLSSKMEITLKSATLPRPRKTSKAEITLSGIKSPEKAAFKSEVEAKIDAFQPQRLRTQRSEVAFPVAAAVPQTSRSSSLEPEGRPKVLPKERIIPIQLESGQQQAQYSSAAPSKPPMPQRSMSQRSGSLSRQSTADSDTDSALGSIAGPEPIRKSPREYIIPIAVEGGGYVTPRSGSVEPESKTNTPTTTNPPRSRFGRPRRMSSLLSDASEDESPFSTLHRDSEDLLQRHMHRLRSSRPSRQPSEHGDSLSSGEDDDDDGFELLTAENLFSTLLSRVRSLTQRLNVDDNRSSGFSSSRLLGRLGANSPQTFWGLNKPLSRRLSESQFKHSLNRDADIFSRKDSGSVNNQTSPNSPGSYSTPSRESVFEMGSNTLPRDKVEHEGIEAEAAQFRKEAQESLEQNFTPSLARRLSRQFIEQTRQSLPRSPSIPREKYHSPNRETLSLIESSDVAKKHASSTTSDQTEYRSRSIDRNIRRTNSLLEAGNKADRIDKRFSKRSISLFDDEDNSLLPLPRQIMTLGRKYKDIGKSNSGSTWRDNFNIYRTDKIQEECIEDTPQLRKEIYSNIDNNTENASISECTSISMCNSNTNLMDTTSSMSAKSYETSTESSSNMLDNNKSFYKTEQSKTLENRLLAAENLIKESKLKNLGPSKFNPNLSSNYRDTDKCDKESLYSMSNISTTDISKRRSCIPSLRLRSGSLTRESSLNGERRKSFADSQEGYFARTLTPERSILDKFFRANNNNKNVESKDKAQKPKQHRISRFLRPDFFDTPREESQYIKEKEAQKAAENERRKSRFTKKKNESKICPTDSKTDTKPEKELKNEVNFLKKDKSDISPDDKSKKDTSSDHNKMKFEKQSSKSSFLHSLEKKIERFRSTDEVSKSLSNGSNLINQKARALRENSAPPIENLSTECNLIKRAISVEDLSLKKGSTKNSNKTVSSVLGLFKNSDVKQNTSAVKTQTALINKLKKNTSKPARIDVPINEDITSTSKIPTKLMKNDVKLVKRAAENKKIVDKVTAECKKSPPKDKPKEKKCTIEKQSRELQTRTEKEIQPEKSSSFKDTSVGKDKIEKADLPLKTCDFKNLPNETTPIQTEENSFKQDKKLIKTKKNVSSLKKSNSITKKAEKGENSDTKISKLTKVKNSTEKEDTDGTKKKKIVRVVKKVVKKSSDSSNSKSEEKQKCSNVLTKDTVSPVKQKSPEISTTNIYNKRENNSEQNFPQSPIDTTETYASGEMSVKEPYAQLKTNSNPIDSTAIKFESKASDYELYDDANNIHDEQTKSMESNIRQVKCTEQHANRENLKLDLSKIPQHTFRNSTCKKDSPKSESFKLNLTASTGSPKTNEFNIENDSDKLLDSLSRMTHHATITGNKIIIEKPLRVKDVAELKKEVNECARLIENHIELHNDVIQSESDAILARKHEIELDQSDLSNLDKSESMQDKQDYKIPSASNTNDCTSEILSPADEPDSFDSWSICSADMNHTRGELNSPTSPSYSLFLRGDQSESVIDRIRRRSFYSRFNDRKRPSLSVPPPGVTLPSGSTLPRKYSFGSSRDRDRGKLSNYATTNKRQIEQNYNLYHDDIPSYRKSPVDRETYADRGTMSYTTDFKSPVEQYSRLSYSTYDPLRKYLKSLPLNLSTSRRRYHSTDFSTDNELNSYKSQLSSSLLNSDNAIEYYTNRNSGILPKKYGSTANCSIPKTVEYYEELLSPSNPEYLTARRSPISNEYLHRVENGLHNGNIDKHVSGKFNSCVNEVTEVGLTTGSDNELEERTRTTNRYINETTNLPSTSSDF